MAEAMKLRDDVEDSLTEGELPAQGGGYVPTIMPGFHNLQLPANIDQCWEAKDYEKKDDAGNVVMGPDGVALVEQHLLLKFDKENPMIVQGGNFDGLPFTATISTMARRRGKKTDPNAPKVSDMTYFIRDSLNDNSRIQFRKDVIGIVNKHAGQVVRVESGLSAQCDTERVRYIDDGAGGVIEDPDGIQGCGAAGGKANSRLYTQDFKVKQFQLIDTGEVYRTREEAIEAAGAMGLGVDRIKAIDGYVDRVHCKNPNCGAALRGFVRIERFCKPEGSTTTVRG